MSSARSAVVRPLSLDVPPFRSRPQPDQQFLEGIGCRRRVLEPGQEVKFLTQVAAVMEPPSDGRREFKADCYVV